MDCTKRAVNTFKQHEFANRFANNLLSLFFPSTPTGVSLCVKPKDFINKTENFECPFFGVGADAGDDWDFTYSKYILPQIFTEVPELKLPLVIFEWAYQYGLQVYTNSRTTRGQA